MKRFCVYWKGQDLVATPAAKVCAGHREAACAPLCVPEIKKYWEGLAELVKEATDDGECFLASYGGCCDDPVTSVPVLDVSSLEEVD